MVDSVYSFSRSRNIYNGEMLKVAVINSRGANRKSIRCLWIYTAEGLRIEIDTVEKLTLVGLFGPDDISSEARVYSGRRDISRVDYNVVSIRWQKTECVQSAAIGGSFSKKRIAAAKNAIAVDFLYSLTRTPSFGRSVPAENG